MLFFSLASFTNSALASEEWFISPHLISYYDGKFSKEKSFSHYGVDFGYQITPQISSVISVDTSPIGKSMMSIGIEGNVEINNDWSVVYSLSGASVNNSDVGQEYYDGIMPVVGLGMRYSIVKDLYLKATHESIFNSRFSKSKGAGIKLGFSYHFGNSRSEFDLLESNININESIKESKYVFKKVIKTKVTEKMVIELDFDLDKFNFNSSVLNSEQISVLIEKFKNIPKSANIELTGFTDDRGSEKFNYDFGLYRAKSVKSKLIELGYLEDKIKTSSLGEENPVVINNSKHNRSLNRRVHINVITN
ncbi:OmpA family protein [Photobacterium leiognathi]|uniref:OmpA family protein n=1 Tax=Photobacterium leiognathi TaxID=553611 RepID=UPI002981E903|nr:OmpA family protein [Photobacterium leiognathi]